MLKKTLAALLFIALTVPAPLLAMEQSFTQNDTKATIRLSPDQLVTGKDVTLKLRLEKGGQVVTNRAVALEVVPKDAQEPILRKEVEELDGDYVESWRFEKPGDYKVIVTIAAQEKTEALRYEVMASVADAKEGGHEGHGFMAHHFGGRWGWWGGGLMIVMMVTMMVLL